MSHKNSAAWFARQDPEFQRAFTYALNHPQHVLRRIKALDAWSKDYELIKAGTQMPPLWRKLPKAAQVKLRRNDRATRMRRAERERFTLADVIARDGWTCGICGGQVDPTLRRPDLDSRSLDHVLPISLGGPHMLANAQLAHLGCNLRKGARFC